jgi:hypothetical protein
MSGINITWSSSNATVGNVPLYSLTGIDGNASATFTASAAGTSFVNTSNASLKDSATVTVNSQAPYLATLIIAPKVSTLTLGGVITQTFNATARDQYNNLMSGINITWSSSNATVGTVPLYSFTGIDGNASGTFTASAAGTALVNVTNASLKDSAIVTVNPDVVNPVPPSLTRIKVSPPTSTVIAGGMQKFNATALDENNIPMAGINISWTISNSTVGSATPLHAITGIDGNASTTFTGSVEGTAKVNATNGSVVGNASVTVNSPSDKLTGSISGYKINDTNGNGKWNAGEKGISGWNIKLISIGKGRDGIILKETRTDTQGFYEFADLPAGKYIIKEEKQKGWKHTSSTVRYIDLKKGQNSMNNNFTNILKKPVGMGSISGFKINDTNGNGRWNVGEKGIPGWTIELISKDDSHIKDETVTDENGFYEFNDLPKGNYRIQELMQTGWQHTSSDIRNIELKNAQKSMNNNFTNKLEKKGDSRKTIKEDFEED